MYLSVNPYQELLEGISVALQVNDGILKLTGRDGAGKSALCQELVRQLEASSQRVLYLSTAPATVEALQTAILLFLGLPVEGNFTRRLTRHLQQQSKGRRQLYIIFDEAQQLDERVLESIRMLCNIQDEQQALVKPILCGSPALDTRFMDVGLRSIAQYLSQSFTLPPMTIEQLREFYWAYWKSREVPVQPPGDKVIAILFRESQGFPGPALARLELAHQRIIDRREGREPEPDVDESFVRALPVRRKTGRIGLRLSLAGIAVVAAGVGYLWVGQSRTPSPATDAAVTAPAVTSPVAVAVIPDAPPPGLPVSVADTAATPGTRAAAGTETAEPAADLAGTAVADAADAADALVSAAAEVDVDVDVDTAVETEAQVEAEVATEVATEVESQVEVATATEPSPSAPADTAVQRAAALLDAWAAGWQARDVAAYLGHYHPDFEPPNGLARDVWEGQRRNSISRAGDISITWDDPELVAEDGDAITIRFWLHYRASNYADDTFKELVLEPVDAGLLIRRETNLLVERLP